MGFPTLVRWYLSIESPQHSFRDPELSEIYVCPREINVFQKHKDMENTDTKIDYAIYLVLLIKEENKTKVKRVMIRDLI